MEQEEKIRQLEQKVKELEILRDKCALTNDIKISLAKYIQSNEEFKKEIKEILIKENDTNQKNSTNILIEYKWIFFFIFITIAIIIVIKV